MKTDKSKLKVIKSNIEENKKKELADSYIDKDDFLSAYKIYQEILENNPYDIQSLLNSGSIKFYEKQYDESIKFYERAKEIEPENSFIHYNLGNVLAEAGRFEDSLFEYKKAISLGMEDGQVYNAMGLLYQDNQKFAQAKEYFLKSLKEEPKNYEYLTNYAMLCQKMGHNDEAENNFELAYQINKTEQQALALANFYSQVGKKENAEKYFKTALEIAPDYYSAWVCFAIFCSDNKEFDLAIKYYKNAIELDPKKPNAYMLLAHLLLSEKRYEEAVEIYKKSLDLTANKTMVYIFIANAYMLNLDMDSAIKYYRLAIDFDPCNMEIKLIFIDILNEYIEGKINNEQ